MFEKIYEMYCNGDEKIFEVLNAEIFEELYHECKKDLAKYYEFMGWLGNVEYCYVGFGPM